MALKGGVNLKKPEVEYIIYEDCQYRPISTLRLADLTQTIQSRSGRMFPKCGTTGTESSTGYTSVDW